MFDIGELHYAFKSLPGVCLTLLVFYLVWKIAFRKGTTLPRSRTNNILLYFRWLWLLYKDKEFAKNPIMYWISDLSRRYTKRGMYHYHIPFLDIVFLFSPDTVQPLLQNSTNIEKSIFYHFFEKYLGPNLFVSKGEKWRKQRKLLTPAFHLKNLENLVPVTEEHSKILVKRLMKCERNGWIDVAPLVKRCIAAIIFETTTGTIDKDLDYDFTWEHLDNLMGAMQERTFTIWTWSNIFFRFTSMGRQFRRSYAFIHEKIYRVVKENVSRTQDGEKNRIPREDEYDTDNHLTLFNILLNSLSNDPNFTLRDLMKELEFFLLAGFDTTSLTVIWALYLLGKHPDIQKRVQEEVDVVLKDPGRPLSMNDLQKLKYTECVIKETLRLYPPVPIIARKIIKEITIDGKTISEGFNCIIPIFIIHQNPEIFPNPEVFDPERFLPENCKGRHPYAFIPFSAGQRNCIGQKFSMMEMKIILAKIMKSLALESVDQKIETKLKITLNNVGPVRIRIKRRL